MKMSVYLQTATSQSRDDNYQYIRWLTRTVFFSKTLAAGVATREQH